MNTYLTPSGAQCAGPQRDDDGFSLVELLIVIVVVGILAATTAFAVRGITDRGEEASCTNDARILRSAAGAYMVTESAEVLPSTGSVDGDEYERTLVDAGFIREVSTLHDLSSDGSITIVDSICAPPSTTP